MASSSVGGAKPLFSVDTQLGEMIERERERGRAMDREYAGRREEWYRVELQYSKWGEELEMRQKGFELWEGELNKWARELKKWEGEIEGKIKEAQEDNQGGYKVSR